MCGIAGYLSLSGANSIPWSFATHAAHILRHRGPDGRGYVLATDQTVYTADEIGNKAIAPLPYLPQMHWQTLQEKPAILAFAHNRLSIYDTSAAGHQPMCSDDQQVWLVFNGAIYNFKALRATLLQYGHTFHTQTDTEVILAAYRQWGQACLDRLEGMFAFVIWDRTQQLLWGARDRTGVKPLYFYQDKHGFGFASEQKAFWKAPGIYTDLRKAGVFANLVLRQMDAHPLGLFEHVQALLPGHFFRLSTATGDCQVKQYYTPPATQDEAPKTATIRQALLHSIDLRRQADVPVGVAVSGGIDSGVIAGAMHELGTAPVNAFTVTFPRFSFDESAFAKIMADQVQANWVTCEPTAAGFFTDLQDLVYTQESPIQAASTYAQYALMRTVKETGIKVLIDGQGGDELFAGYHIHQWIRSWELIRQGRLQAAKSFLHITGNTFADSRLMITQLLKRSILPTLPPAWQWQLLMRSNPLLRWLKKDWVHHEWHQLRQLKEPIHDLQSFLQHQYFNGYLSYLLKFADRNSMRFGIESRVPFADDPLLMQQLFTIPGEQKMQAGQSKYLLRQAAKGLLPDAILNRQDKVGFIAPTNQWLASSDDWLSYFEYDSALLDTDRIRREKAKFIPLLTSDRFSHVLPILTTAIWEQTFAL